MDIQKQLHEAILSIETLLRIAAVRNNGDRKLIYRDNKLLLAAPRQLAKGDILIIHLDESDFTQGLTDGKWDKIIFQLINLFAGPPSKTNPLFKELYP